MNRIYFILSLSFFTIQQLYAQTSIAIKYNNQLTTLVDNFYEEGLKLDPIRATFNGDNRYNDLLYIDFTDSFRLAQMQMYNRYLSQLKKINRAELNANNKISYDVLNHELQIRMEGLALRSNRILFHQMNGLHTLLATLGGGTVIQPFKTVKDYDNWLKRASVFPAWADSAIVYFKKGIAEGIVLPKTLVIKIIPQLDAQVVSDVTKSVFYGPINKMPASFSKEDKERLTESYTKLITEQLSPAYNRLSNFMKNEYLPKARLSSGYSALPDGEKMYDYYIRQYTTTNKTADEIFKIGLAEVARIQKEMEKVKKEVGYTGDLKSFFEYMRTDPKFFPYKTPEEIINEYYVIQKAVEPKLKRMFNNTPKTPFEVRQTDSFRAASSPPQYASGSLENNRPEIFYIPIVDVKKVKVEECLFLHEAIPGHHYQIMLQKENESLPKFRRFGGNSAYIEGWGLYAESLGKELGLYTDPYQYMYALGMEIHRAIRLVVDAGLHTKGWTREQAIQYMLDNEPVTDLFATSEIERYMAWPGQALSYKIGELKIKELRAKYIKLLGSAFDLAAFHDAILMDGAVPLDVLERKMDAWAKEQMN